MQRNPSICSGVTLCIAAHSFSSRMAPALPRCKKPPSSGREHQPYQGVGKRNGLCKDYFSFLETEMRLLIAATLLLTACSTAWGEEALSKFTGNFECAGTESAWGNLCVKVDVDLDAFWMGTCGYTVFKGLDIVSKSPTRIVITSTNSDRTNTRFFEGKPDTSFFYVLTDWFAQMWNAEMAYNMSKFSKLFINRLIFRSKLIWQI